MSEPEVEEVDADAESEAGDVELVEEEVEEAFEVPPEESSDITSAAEPETESNEGLGQILELPLEVLEAVGGTVQGNLLLDKVKEHLQKRDSQVEEYQAALNVFTQNMNQQHGEH